MAPPFRPQLMTVEVLPPRPEYAGGMTRIVTTAYRPKRAPRKRTKAAPLAVEVVTPGKGRAGAAL